MRRKRFGLSILVLVLALFGGAWITGTIFIAPVYQSVGDPPEPIDDSRTSKLWVRVLSVATYLRFVAGSGSIKRRVPCPLEPNRKGTALNFYRFAPTAFPFLCFTVRDDGNEHARICTETESASAEIIKQLHEVEYKV